MNEEELKWLFRFIAGKGEFEFLVSEGKHQPGIHTSPGSDKINDAIHAGCEELERRGLIERTINDWGHCFFRAKE